MRYRRPRPRPPHTADPAAPSRRALARRIAALEESLAAEREARQGLEERLQEASRLGAIIDQAPVLVYRYDLDDPQGTFSISPHVERLLGFTPAEWAEVDGRWSSLLHPDDRARLKDPLANVLAHGGSYTVEYRIRHKAGHYVWLRDEAMLLYNAGGRPITLVGFAVGISKRKQFEESLRAAEATYHALARSLPDGVVRVDRELRVTYLNPAAAALLSEPVEQLIGRRYDEIGLPPDLTELWGSGLRRALAAGTPSSREVVLRTPDGVRTLEARSIPEFDGAGELIGVLGISRDMTEQRAAQEVLRTSEERLRTVLAGMPVMLDAFDEQRRLVLWNEECERVTGYSAAELLGSDTVIARLYPDPGYYTAMLERWQSRGASFRNWELALTRKDGERRIVAWSNVSDELPVPGWSFWAVGVDVTEQRAAEAALRRSDERLRLAIETGGMMAFEVELPSFRLVVHAASSELRIPPPETMRPISLQESTLRDIHPDDHELVQRTWARAVAERAGFEYEVRFRHGDGTYHWAFVRSRFVPASDDRPDRIIGVFLDINERRAMQEALLISEAQLRALNAELEQRVAARTRELREANQALAASQQSVSHNRDLLQTVLDGIEDGLALLDRDGVVVMANEHLVDLYRLPARPIGARWAAICGPSFALAARSLAQGRSAAERFTLARPDGTRLTLEAQSLPVPGNGPAEQVVLHIADITEQLQLEVTALENERLATGGRLAAIIAHEVNSPLQAIQNFLFLASSDDRAERDIYLGLISEEIDRIGALIRRLLEIELPEESDLATVNLNDLVSRVLRLTHASLARRGVEPRTALARGPLEVLARADHLLQVLLNLCLNGADAMAGGGPLTITTGVCEVEAPLSGAGSAAFIAVSDTGPGIGPAELGRIFEPHYHARINGSGLGLAVCQQLVEQSGGRIEVRSAVGEGTTFTVLLPLPADSPA